MVEGRTWLPTATLLVKLPSAPAARLLERRAAPAGELTRGGRVAASRRAGLGAEGEYRGLRAPDILVSLGKIYQ